MSIETNWYVITGGPSSGKTKVIEYLAFLGYFVIPEVARILIDLEISKGKLIEEIRSDKIKFQKKVLEMKIKIEDKISPERLTFFDRGIPDSIAYDQIYGLDIEQTAIMFRKRRYKKIFLLEQVPFRKDYGRVEDEKFANNISGLLYKSYLDLGYNVLKIPKMPIDKRAEFILKEIKKDN